MSDAHDVASAPGGSAHHAYRARLGRGDRIAEGLARRIGSWAFVGVYVAAVVIAFLVLQVLIPAAWDSFAIDVVAFSLAVLAGVIGAIIVMAQNRQEHANELLLQREYGLTREADERLRRISQEVGELRAILDEVREQVRAGSGQASVGPARGVTPPAEDSRSGPTGARV